MGLTYLNLILCLNHNSTLIGNAHVEFVLTSFVGMGESVGLRVWNHLGADHSAVAIAFGPWHGVFFLPYSEKTSWLLAVTPGDVF